ncbi:MAG: type I-E CRISPR-associated protein Cse1/CasA [Nitrosomonas sp.]|nr:type I-E CRISPR-associated protein Cse1/CasA [Nitrosomonas sp.]
MNLVTEAWIPVVRQDGKPATASLMQVFTAGKQFSDLAVRPHERIALMRLLICIAQAALDGPEDIDAWDDAPNTLPKAAKKYFEEWEKSFDLFDPEKPFLQISTIAKLPKAGKTSEGGEANDLTSVGKLDFSLATGNNALLFDHGGQRDFSPEALTLMLLTFQQFSPGGLIGKVTWGSKETSKSSAHAPCTPSSMLHTFLRRDTVLDTICANLLTKEAIAQHFNKPFDECWGQPVWERMPANPDDKTAIDNATQTYLGRLVPLARLIRIVDGSNMLLGDGLAYPAFESFPEEVSAIIVVSRDGTERKLLRADSKAVWRELSALTVSRKQGKVGGALVLENVPENAAFDLWVGALLTNKATILDTAESVFHIPAKMRTDNGRAAYSGEVQWAENIAGKLGWAVETYRKESDGGWEGRLEMTKPQDRWKLKEKLRAATAHYYWTAVEKNRPMLVAHVEAIGTTAEAVEKTREAWRKAVHGAARQAYALACGQETPRQIRAFALGLGKLFAKQQSDDSEEPETIEVED